MLYNFFLLKILVQSTEWRKLDQEQNRLTIDRF
uniref:Uncharacterized protein n=1 Tax=Rhizophora mucronata TaxID=61149 RepID=A0A2P2PH85_RHIMU